MKILYLSVLTSSKALEDARKRDSSFSAYAVYKFSKLVAEGFVKNGHHVRALSTFYQPNVGLGYCRSKEEDNGVVFSYIPTFNSRLFHFFWAFIYCFFYVLFWGIWKREDKAVVCDVLNVSACIGAVAASKFLRLRCVGVVTDMPGTGVNENDSGTHNTNEKLSITARINKSYLGKFSHYVFLTEQMNESINVNRRPYIVMEGLVDATIQVPDLLEKAEKKVVIYAGGLYERYGLKLLVDAFIQANIDNTELWLYGDGPFVKQLLEYSNRDPRIIYKGIHPNQEVVKAELQATLLVNPRPTNEEFTKYSFPSKNMEYMVSGTPVLTTPLPGMPSDYYPYVYLFDKGENVLGYVKSLEEVLSKTKEELIQKGKTAREFVLDNKNNIKQAKRIIDLINN